MKFLEPRERHFAKFRAWVTNKRSSSALRRTKIDELTSKLLNTDQKATAVGIRRILDNYAEIFTGEKIVLDLLLQDGILAQIYDVSTFDYSRFFTILSHTRPTLRILEIGAGTGATTETILRTLTTGRNTPAYDVYTFTDISPGFFPAAQERFAYAPNMEFKVLDVSQDPGDQGFQENSYNVIIAANVIHATPSLHNTLVNMRSLLKPDGLLAGRLGEDDGRPDQPFVSVSRWDQELKDAGYSGVDVPVYDLEEPYRHGAAIVASKILPLNVSRTPITLLTDYPEEHPACTVAAALEAQEWVVTMCQLGGITPAHQDIISCLDLEDAFFQDISQQSFRTFQDFASTSAQTLGVARRLRTELELNFYTLECNSHQTDLGNLVTSVFERILKDSANNVLEPDREYLVHSDAVCVGRFHPFLLAEDVPETSRDEVMRRRLTIDKPGILSTLSWKAVKIPPEIAANHVEIEVRSSGLNFHDVMAIKLISSDKKYVPLGAELSGTVVRVGSGVNRLAVGDRVMAVCQYGAFATHVTFPEDLVRKVPEGMSFEEAATFQGCFVTVIHALLDVARMKKGSSVLVHSACGGVGLAALQVVKMMQGEGNYHAGRTFIEAFCQYRHSLGLPASVLSIGLNEDVGYVAERPAVLRDLKRRGLYGLGEKGYSECVEASLRHSAPEQTSTELAAWKNHGHVAIGLRSNLQFDDLKNAAEWARDRRMGTFHNFSTEIASTTRVESSRLKTFLGILTDGDEASILADAVSTDFPAFGIGTKINDLLLEPDVCIDTRMKLVEMGLDSLTTIELRRWFRQALGLQLSVLEMMGAASLRQVGEMVATRLGDKVASSKVI
ncbi:unnamed protein product [Fusarium equiseti]|uniref:Carrier domain-containing protein n=1 Tax=Fusarium equiseti TaxID=61235 RepID=A0A8J2IL57_FUSEQ|nr:unnamed protein product [Fusarium equiseti]